MNIAKLFASIGIKADTAPAERFEKQLKNVKTTLAVAGVAAGTFTAALGKITQEALESAAALKQFEAETGASAQELQKWQAVANQTNSSAQAVTQSIKSLEQNRARFLRGEGNIKAFQLLGIDPNQDPFKIMDELREKTKSLAPAMRRDLLQQAGVSSDLVQVMDLTNEQFDTMASRAFIIPPSAIDSMDRARGFMQQIGNAIKYLKGMITAALAPNMEKMAKQFTEFVKLHEEDVIRVVKEVTRYIGEFVGAVIEVVKWINNFIQNTMGWKAALMGLIGLFVALNSAVLLPVAGIILLFGLIEDITRYSQGKSSLIGRLFEQFPALEGVFDGLMKPLRDFFDLMKEVFFGSSENIAGMLEDWGALGFIVEYIAEQIAILKEGIENLFSGEGIADKLTEMSGLMPVIGEIMNASQGEQGYLEAVGKGLGGMVSNSMAGKAVQRIFNRNENNNIEINVNGAGSPEETAAAVRREFQNSADERAGALVE